MKILKIPFSLISLLKKKTGNTEPFFNGAIVSPTTSLVVLPFPSLPSFLGLRWPRQVVLGLALHRIPTQCKLFFLQKCKLPTCLGTLRNFVDLMPNIKHHVVGGEAGGGGTRTSLTQAPPA